MEHYVVEELSLELTNQCELACIHCSSGSTPKRLSGELSFDEHLRLVHEARDLGATVLSLSGGDPLVYNPDGYHGDVHYAMVELINAAMDIGYESILIYTTGHGEGFKLVRDYPMINQLLGVKKITWIFSLHSHNKDVNNFIMNKSYAFDDIINSIEWLTTKGETVEVHMVPMAVNYQHIPRMRDLCRMLGVRKMSCLRFVPQGRGKESDVLAMDKAQFAEMQFILHQEAERIHAVEIRMGCPIDFRHSVGLLDHKAKPCHAGDDLILVRPTGDVHPCAAWKTLPADSNVKEQSLKDIWENSQVFNAIRRFKYGAYSGMTPYFSPGYTKVGGVCSRCILLSSCMTGCPAQRLHAYDGESMDTLFIPYSDPLCPRGNGDTYASKLEGEWQQLPLTESE